jgi:hypothetical protein
MSHLTWSTAPNHMPHFRPLPNTRSRALLVLLGVCLLGMASGCFKTKQVLDTDGESDGGSHLADVTNSKKHDAETRDAGSSGGTAASHPDGGSFGEMSSPGYAAIDSICGTHSRCVALNDVDKVDLLFVVDNSNSMKEEQDRLRTEFGSLISALTTGKGTGFKFTPASLHLGVVSSDMGLPGVQKVDKCMGLGDDGLLLHTPTSDPDVPGCQAEYPMFLSVNPGDDVAQAATDFQCIASLGIDGCGFEQQLEAGLKAVWPSIDPGAAGGRNRILFLGDPNPTPPPSGMQMQPSGTPLDAGAQPDASASLGDDILEPPLMPTSSLGHGDTANKGFLRDGDGANPSLLAVVVLSDEDDGSSNSVEHFIPKQFLDPNDPRYNEPLNLRNFYHKDELYPLTRYVDGLQALRPSNQNLVVFGAIAGVPAEALNAVGTQDVGTNSMVRQAFYERVLADPMMQEMIDPATMSVPGQGNLLPSCSTTDADGVINGKAYPAVRLVQVARGFGANGFIDSICRADFKPAIDQLIDRIGARLGSGCLDTALPRGDDGLVPNCKVLWQLPNEPHSAGTPSVCGQQGWEFLKKGVSDTLCEVTQLPVLGGFDGKHAVPEPATMISQGWYYDDFSDKADLCMRSQARIAFVGPSVPPPAGVHAILDCE